MKKIYFTFILTYISLSSLLAQQLVADIGIGSNSSNPDDLVVYNNKLYFTAESPTFGRELFVTQGYSWTTNLVNDILPGVLGSNPTNKIVYNNKLFFSADGRGLNNTTELYYYDDSSNQIIEIPAPTGVQNEMTPENLLVINGKLYFSAVTNNGGRRKLFEYDGNIITQVNISNSLNYDSILSEYKFVYNNNILYFIANDISSNTRMYFIDISNGILNLISNISYPNYFIIHNNFMYLRGQNPIKFLKIDLLNNHTVNILNNPAIPLETPLIYNDKLYYSAIPDAIYGGTIPSNLGIYDTINDTYLSSYSLNQNHFTAKEIFHYNGKIYFQANFDNGVSIELGEYDPNLNTVSLTSNINSNTGQASVPENFCVFNGDLYFSANDGTSGKELFKYNAPFLSNENFNIEQKYLVLPNPVENKFSIDSTEEIKSLHLYNLQGKLVKAFKNQNNYDISSLNSGIYMGKIETENNKNEFIKIIKR